MSDPNEEDLLRHLDSVGLAPGVVKRVLLELNHEVNTLQERITRLEHAVSRARSAQDASQARLAQLEHAVRARNDLVWILRDQLKEAGIEPKFWIDMAGNCTPNEALIETREMAHFKAEDGASAVAQVPDLMKPRWQRETPWDPWGEDK